AAAQSRLSINNRNLQRQLQYQGLLGKRVGRSPTMQEIFALSQLAGPTNACVLISGERGTGKELAGRTIHALNPHRHGPFFAINCAARPETLIDMELLGHEKGAFTGTAEPVPVVSRWPERNNSCACWKTRRCGGRVERPSLRWMSAEWPRPTRFRKRPCAAV